MTSTPSSSKSNQTLTLNTHPCPCGFKNCFLEESGATSPTAPNITCTPENSEITILPPQIGQSFQTDSEALEFYTNFARSKGFSIRKERSKGNPEHPLGVYKRELVCHRAGLPLPPKQQEQENDSKPKKRKKSVPARCKCEAQMVIKKVSEGGSAKWVVVNFNNNHNHEFLEGNFVNLYTHRYISQADKGRILTLAKSGCNSGFIIKTLETEKKVKLSLTEKDIKNFLRASESVQPEYEGEELLKSCKLMQEKNPEFRYEFSLREENNNKLENILWSYLGAIRGYKVFGDVVIFDNSQKLCNYERPVLVWFGLDSNGNLMFFSCAVLFDNSFESYKWAFQAFLNIMDGKPPQSILTDLSTDLKAIIRSQLPNTKHAFSFSHILSKLHSWFSPSLPNFLTFKSPFLNLNNSESVEEFEREWGELIRDFDSGILKDRHLEFLFENREFWGVPYLKSWFFGGVIGNGMEKDRMEMVREFFAGFLDSNTRLKDFVEQVGVAVDFQNQAAEESTENQIQQKPNLKTCLPIESHASKILTPYSFSLLQTEIVLSNQYAVFDASNETYLVRHYLKTGTDGAHMVSCVPANEEISCTCKGFEFSGVLCRHVIRVLSLKNCFVVPDRYVLPRWRLDGSVFERSNGIKFRSKALKSLGDVLVQEGFITKDRFDYVELQLTRVLDGVREMEDPGVDLAASDWPEVGMEVGFHRQVATRDR